MTVPTELPAPFGRYSLLKKLGTGGMGAVYLAHDSQLDRSVALKVPHLDETSAAEVLERFYREARVAASISHVHLCRVYDVGQHDNIPYLTMEFVEGTTLRRLVGPDRPWPPRQAAALVSRLARALDLLHQRRVMHRDLKPENIMIRPDGEPVVMDFGLARSSTGTNRLTKTGAVVGTPVYMAPEQVNGDPQAMGTSCDIYSLGAILYELLTGQPPFDDSLPLMPLFNQIFSKEPAAPSALRPGLDAALDAICLKPLAKGVEGRYASMTEFADVLEVYLRQTELASAVAASPPTADVARVSCPKCGKRLKIPAAVWGKRVHCPTCQTRFSLASDLPTHSVPQHAIPSVVVAPPALPQEMTNFLGMKFVLISQGSFWMGGEGGTPGTQQVEIVQDFYLGAYEVTQGQWKAVMGKDNNPSWFSRKGDGKDSVKDISAAELEQFPVERVSWEDTQEFMKRLNALEKDSGWLYRLPKEAEWEHACRGGLQSKEESAFDFYLGQPTNDLSSKQANFHGGSPAGNAAKGKYLGRTTRVGSYQSNRLGLYDMHGNVWEWCENAHDGGSDRVVRGGSWFYSAKYCRSAYRDKYAPSIRSLYLGFRAALVPSGSK